MPTKKTDKKPTNKKTPAKKAITKKTTTKKAPAKKTVAKKTATKKAPAKKTVVKKTTAKKSERYEESQFLASIKPYALKKNEKYMNAKQQQHFQDILASWSEQLQIEQDRTADKIQKNVSHFPEIGRAQV